MPVITKCIEQIQRHLECLPKRLQLFRDCVTHSTNIHLKNKCNSVLRTQETVKRAACGLCGTRTEVKNFYLYRQFATLAVSVICLFRCANLFHERWWLPCDCSECVNNSFRDTEMAHKLSFKDRLKRAFQCNGLQRIFANEYLNEEKYYFPTFDFHRLHRIKVICIKVE